MLVLYMAISGSFSVGFDKLKLEAVLAFSLMLIEMALCAGMLWYLRKKLVDRLILEALMVVAAFIVLELSPGNKSTFLPGIYLMAGILAAYSGMADIILVIVLFVGMDTARALWDGFSIGALMDTGQRTGYIILFALAFAAFFRTERARTRRLKSRLSLFNRNLEEFRSRTKGDELKKISEQGRKELLEQQVARLQEGILGSLESIAEILKPYSLVLFTLKKSDKNFYFREAVSETESIDHDSVVQQGQGILGWVVEQKELLRITKFSNLNENLPYYPSDMRISSLIAAPVLGFNGDEVDGLLIADSKQEGFFGPEDEKLMRIAAHQVQKELESAETRQKELMESRAIHGLFSASERLNRSIDLEMVLDNTIGCIEQIVEYDLAVLAIFDEAEGVSTIVKSAGNWDVPLEGLKFGPEDGMVGWVTSPTKYLFYPDFKHRQIKRPVFAAGFPSIKNIGTFYSYPLFTGEQFLGTVTLFMEQEKALNDYEREAVTTLARQAATSISNAYLHQSMETMATTDGLTGLYNHRYFQGKLIEEIERVARNQQPVSIVLIDIDHFKKVNDTYGHPVGDVVLKGLGKLFTESVRTIDTAARYGGEEFVLILPEADRKGAKELAERIRKNAKRMKFRVDDVELRITISIGIATYPEDARGKERLIEAADEALYFAKENGRNKTVVYSDIPRREEPVLKAVGKRRK